VCRMRKYSSHIGQKTYRASSSENGNLNYDSYRKVAERHSPRPATVFSFLRVFESWRLVFVPRTNHEVIPILRLAIANENALSKRGRDVSGVNIR
jgi:hypothetical protein